MSTSINHRAFDRATDPIFSILSREQVAHFADLHADESLHQRISELAAKANEGELTPDEQAEKRRSGPVLTARQMHSLVRTGPDLRYRPAR